MTDIEKDHTYVVGQLVLAKSGLAAACCQLPTCFQAIKIKFTTAAVSCLCCCWCCCCCCSYCLGYLLHMRRLFASRYPYPPCHGKLSSNCRHSANNLTLMHVEFNCFMYESTRTVFPMLAPGPTQRAATLHMAV